MKIYTLLIVLFVFFFFPLVSLAHPGRTDSSGCHTCKTNCPNWGLDYGEYHCHNSKSTAQPKEPVKSVYGTNGTGSVVPAPEYKTSKLKPSNMDTEINAKVPNNKNWWNPFTWF